MVCMRLWYAWVKYIGLLAYGVHVPMVCMRLWCACAYGVHAPMMCMRLWCAWVKYIGLASLQRLCGVPR